MSQLSTLVVLVLEPGAPPATRWCVGGARKEPPTHRSVTVRCAVHLVCADAGPCEGAGELWRAMNARAGHRMRLAVRDQRRRRRDGWPLRMPVAGLRGHLRWMAQMIESTPPASAAWPQ